MVRHTRDAATRQAGVGSVVTAVARGGRLDDAFGVIRKRNRHFQRSSLWQTVVAARRKSANSQRVAVSSTGQVAARFA